MIKIKLLAAVACMLFVQFVKAEDSALILAKVSNTEDLSLSKVLYKFVPNTGKSVVKYEVAPLPSIAPNAEGVHFIKIPIEGTIAGNDIIWLKLPYLNCEKISVHLIDTKGNKLLELHSGTESNGLSFRLDSLPAGTAAIEFKIQSTFAIFFPIKFIKSTRFFNSEKRDSFFYSLYFGIIIIMSIYNLFVFFSTKSISYLYYSLYSITFGMAQFCLVGFFHSLIASDFILNKQFVALFSGASGVFGVLFFNSFLETKKTLPRIRKGLYLFLFIYLIICILGIAKVLDPIFNLLNLAGMGVGLMFLFGSGYLAYQGNRPAMFYLAAWVTFISSLVFFILTNVGLIPFNAFTQFLMPLGSAIEISLLSFALADKINILSQQNENLILEQNIILEQQVAERTSELMATNESLKHTQTQLVNSEKMASLGHLTAGIAHEINNPINFISANISPLKRDIEDYELLMDSYAKVDESNYSEQLQVAKKTAEEIDIVYLKNEIQMLLSGIDEGARRTAEIVKNLKIFSHIDQAEHSYYSVNEGITSTLRLLSHKLDGVKIIQELEEIPPILCFPGKLNQVFMNLLSNALDALIGRENPEIGVKTTLIDNNVLIKIRDNGTGIPEDIIQNIFNPFFTTKDVGSGTGLGLSITQSIVKDHNGEIKVESVIGDHTVFTITLPIME